MQILATIRDPAYILMMYPDDPEDTVVSRREYLADLYLNSPDKGVRLPKFLKVFMKFRVPGK